MIQAWSSTLNQNSIKCAKRQVSLFLIFILRLLLCGNNSLLQPPLVCSKDIEFFVKYRDHRKFMHSMMGLREDFEPTRASLLNWSPTPSLDAIVKEFISEENRWHTYHMSSSDHVLATPSPQPLVVAFTAPPRINSGRPNSQASKGTRCEFCRTKGHDISVCRKL